MLPQTPRFLRHSYLFKTPRAVEKRPSETVRVTRVRLKCQVVHYRAIYWNCVARVFSRPGDPLFREKGKSEKKKRKG